MSNIVAVSFIVLQLVGTLLGIKAIKGCRFRRYYSADEWERVRIHLWVCVLCFLVAVVPFYGLVSWLFLYYYYDWFRFDGDYEIEGLPKIFSKIRNFIMLKV